MKYKLLKLPLVVISVLVVFVIVFLAITRPIKFNEKSQLTDNFSQEHALALIISKLGSKHYDITNYIYEDCVLAWKQVPTSNICENRVNGVKHFFSSLDIGAFSRENTLIQVRGGEHFEVFSAQVEVEHPSSQITASNDLLSDELNLETPETISNLEDFLETAQDRRPFFSSYVNYCNTETRYSEQDSFYSNISNHADNNFSVFDLEKAIIQLANQCKQTKGK